MSAPVRWELHFWDKPRPVDHHKLDALEQQWGVRLPGDYRRLVAACQGMTPTPSSFKLAHGDDVFHILLTVDVYEGLEPYSIPKVYELLRSYVPTGIYPFANTPGNEYLCFDYRDAPEEPRIVLVTTEMHVLPVANSFQALLERLHEI